jgi:hypothetical protein
MLSHFLPPPLPPPQSWYPGHMTQFSRMLPNLLKHTDVVLELRDARLPLTSVNRNFEGKSDCVMKSLPWAKKKYNKNTHPHAPTITVYFAAPTGVPPTCHSYTISVVWGCSYDALMQKRLGVARHVADQNALIFLCSEIRLPASP